MRTKSGTQVKRDGILIFKIKTGEDYPSTRKGFACQRIVGLILFISLILVDSSIWAEPTIGLASYYTVKSCLKESGQYRMANGRLLDDEKLTAASWFYPFGQRLLITNLDNGRQAKVICTDRGPTKRLVKKGRIIDLSKRAFSEIAPLKQGIIHVRIERIK